jgi:hypothetical protein
VEARLPADTLEMVLVEDIALLIWKKARLDRAESAVQVCNLQKHDLERRKLFIQVGREISDSLQSEVREKGLRTTLDAPGKFEQVLSILDILVDMVEKNDFSPNMQEFIRALYGVEPTLRGAGFFNNYFRLTELQPGSEEFEAAKALFRARLAEEISDVVQEYELFLHEHVENSRAARLAATAPLHAQWAAIIRQQNALHRQLERKIRLLAEMQERRKKEAGSADLFSRFAGLPDSSGGSGGGVEAPPTPNEGVCATPCDHLGVRQRSLRSCRLGRHMPTACPDRRERTCHRSLRTADLEMQDRAAPSFGEEPRTPRPGVRASHSLWRNRKKILNRGNEPKNLLKKKELHETAPLKRTPFCAANTAIEPKKGAISRQESGSTTPPGTATKCVGASGAGPGPNAVRPYKVGKMHAKRTSIYGVAMQSRISRSAALLPWRPFACICSTRRMCGSEKPRTLKSSSVSV